LLIKLGAQKTLDEVDVYNNTPYTLKLKSTTAVHGSWKVSPPSAITPSQKDASFSMQDPSMAAAGSKIVKLVKNSVLMIIHIYAKVSHIITPLA
jgi:hypothetical protein